MANSIPYLALILISLLFMAVAWLTAKSKKLILLYLTIVGLIYLFEFIVLVLLNAYEYRPNVFRNPYFDNIFGANVSDGFIVPSVVVLITILNLGIWWKAIFILFFMGTEELFLQLGIYHHYWWRTIYTGISLPVAFWLGKRIWYIILYQMSNVKMRLMVIYLSDLSIQSTLFFYLASALHLFFFHLRWFSNSARTHIAFSVILILIESLSFSFTVVYRKKWVWNFSILGAITFIYWFLYENGIMEVRGIWSFPILIGMHAAIVILLILFQMRLLPDTMEER